MDTFFSDMFHRVSGSNPVKVLTWFILVLLIFGGMILYNYLQKQKYQKQRRQQLYKKWKALCVKYKLSPQEKGFLEEVATQFLQDPDKIYLLLANPQVFKASVAKYIAKHQGKGEDLVHLILDKTKMVPGFAHLDRYNYLRRQNKRIKVDLPAEIEQIRERAAVFNTKIVDIGRGGVKMENPELIYHTNDDVLISFEFQDQEYAKVPCTVRRTSKGGRYLHIAFGLVR